MTMDLQQHHHVRREPRCSSSSNDAVTPRGSPVNGSPPQTVQVTSLRPPAVTSVTSPSGIKRSFDVAFLVAPDERRRNLHELPQDLTQRSAFTKVNKVIDLSADRLSPYSSPSSPPFPFPPKTNYHYPFLMEQQRDKLIDNYLNKCTTSSSLHTSTYSTNKLRPMLYPEAYISAAYPYAAANFVTQSPQSNGNTSPTARTAAELLRSPNTSSVSPNNSVGSFTLSPNTSVVSALLRPNSSSVSPTNSFPNNTTVVSAPSVISAPFLAAAAAAAISPVSSLLPPSLAALSLPAQNVCAKCNLSFRMTSDLVYHMRSHHKSETTDFLKRRREEKLKCPVCSESFRERHHLTRHMTAHQDKAGDGEEVMTPAAQGHLIAGK